MTFIATSQKLDSFGFCGVFGERKMWFVHTFAVLTIWNFYAFIIVLMFTKKENSLFVNINFINHFFSFPSFQNAIQSRLIHNFWLYKKVFEFFQRNTFFFLKQFEQIFLMKCCNHTIYLKQMQFIANAKKCKLIFEKIFRNKKIQKSRENFDDFFAEMRKNVILFS